jgi:hypothetical protein
MKTETARILIAVPIYGGGHVVATDSGWAAFECDDISTGCDDLGIEHPTKPGIYLWEGTLKIVAHQTHDGWEPTTEYDGACRVPALEELPGLLEMAPPPVPEEEQDQ